MTKEKIGAEEIYLAPEKNTSAEANKALVDEVLKAENTVKVRDNLKKNIRVCEIPELRERNRKVFKMSDGTEQAVFYSESVHVFDEDTKSFDEVDSTIVEQEDGRHFVCGKNHFVAKFSNEEENDELFSIESGMHRVSVSAKKSKKNINNGKKPLLKKKKTDTLLFESVVDGSDYEYSVNGDGIKENIVVKEKADVYRYPFVIHMDNVIAKFDETNKRVAFISNENGEEVFFIPTPFMTDANGVISNAVSYEIKNTTKGDLSLNVIADSDWINAEERAFPIVIDPQIQLSGQSAMSTYSWEDGSLYTASSHTVGATRCKEGLAEKSRMYVSFKMPTLPRNPRIKKAELKFFQKSSSIASSGDIKIGLYHVTDSINTGNTTPSHSTDLIDVAVMQKGGCNSAREVSYTFDVTTLVDQVNKGEISVKNLVLKMINEDLDTCNTIKLCGSNNNSYPPQLIINYESSYGVNTSYRTHTHQIGRFGQGSIDLQCGNLMFESDDFSWSGNRMPVTIKHLYNSALCGYQYTSNSSIKLSTANFSAMKMGYGYKLNIMQSMISTNPEENAENREYVYIGENGEETVFKFSQRTVCCNNDTQCYNLYESESGGMLYDPIKNTIEHGDDIYHFDNMGRLVLIEDSYHNKMQITYNSNRITCVTDGAGRDFNFGYNSSGFLTSITAPDETRIIYSYSGNLLNTINYPDGRKVSIAYTSNKPTLVTLFDASGNSVYKVAYVFSGDRIQSVTEYGSNSSIGAMSRYSYSAASGRTVVETTEQADTGESTNNVIKTVYTFDDDGNIVSEYVYSEDTGNVGANGEEGGINPHSGDGGAGVVSNINNLLADHNFESLDNWHGMSSNSANLSISKYAYESYAKFGRKVLRMQSYQSDCEQNGVYQTTATLPAGDYTFSAYMRVVSKFEATTNKGAYIRVATSNDTVLAESEHVFEKDGEFIRLIAPFTLNTSQSVQVQLLFNGKGKVYFDAPQLENNPTANAYNMLENGNFERSTGWSLPSGVSYSNTAHFNMSKSICLSGNVEQSRSTYQRIYVKKRRDVRETFTLSGWAKGYGLPVHDNGVNTTFRLRAAIKYLDAYYGEYGTEEYTADFSPCTEEWQLASVEFSKSKYRAVQYIDVFIDYDYNYGTAYFDDIQLVRNSIETGLSAGDFEGEPAEDTTEATTVSDIEPEETKDSGFSELTDCYGNALTETTFTDGEFGTIYRSFKYNSDTDCICGDDSGNNLISETDARGNLTEYTVDEFTSRNEEVIDRCKNKTSYQYDASGRTTKVTSHRPKRDSNGKIMTDQQGNIIYEEISNVSYKYDSFDNLSEIARGDGLKYALKYNAFHNLESIGINGKTDGDLIKYTYKNGNGKLKEMTYANGDKMTATYNGIGQMVAEKWFDKNNYLTAYYKYVYDGQGNIVRSIDILATKEYNYLYEDGRIMQSTESDITLDSNNIVTSKVFVCTVRYYYDAEDGLVKKRIQFANGSEHTVNYEKAENDSQVVRFTAGGRTVTSHSKTDSFGRKEFDELQLGTASISRQFYYHAGVATDEHKNKSMVKSAPTTQLVSRILLSNGHTISYEYDEEERITKVDDSVDGITAYTYDALGQLVTETVNGITTKFKYDNYGNILAKGVVDETGEIAEATKITYAYDDEHWHDLLTAYNGQVIVYDAQGNPTSYLGHTLTWEKGRQLKSFDNIAYTYNANGIRTSKTVNGVRHDYVLDGAKILREAWNYNETTKTYDDVLVPFYDNEDSVCGIEYNGTAYYFLKNQQGDIIAVTDSWGNVVARYTYDVWGVCTVADDTSGCGIANINPFRYRGYYYDREIGLYYVSSRYYDPEIGRFLNADEATYLGADSTVLSYNLYAYCENEPTNNEDRSGNWLLRVVCGVAAGAVFGGVALAICTLLKLSKKQKTYISLAFTALGVLLGALLGVKILTKVAPQLVKWFRKIEKNIAFSFKGKECKVGVELFHVFKIMIHRPHTKSLHKYNPIGWHIQFEIKWLGRWIVVFRIKIDTVVKWYQSMK